MWSSKRGSSAPTTPCNHAFEERQAEATRSRLKTWLRSPRIPARRLGQVDFSVREAALAVGMSPAREPPGTSPGSPSGAFLTERTVDELRDHEPADATTVRREGNSARRDGATLEATVAESVDSRLQVVEEALLELNQDLLAATSQLRQLQARCETSVVTDFDKVFGGTPQLQIETRLLALEDFCGKSEAQSKELHTLCLALDQRAAGLDQDLTCVVEEVESRLKRMSEHLTTTQVEIRESLRCSPREPNSSPSSLLPWKDWPTSAGEALQVQDKQTTWSIEELQQALLVMQKQMSTFAAELNDAKSGAERVQQALQQAKETSTFSEADTTKHGSNTETSKQVLTDVQKQMSSFDAELKDARKGAEEMWQALQEVKWKTTCANADQTISGMTEALQQALTEIQKQMGSLLVELKDTKRGSEEMQQALQEMDEKITSTDADAKSVGKSTQRFHQVLTEVQKQMSSLDAEMKEARKDAEGMQQAFQELNEKTLGSEKDSKIAAKSTEALQQALTEIQKQMGSLHVELKDTKRGSEDMQQDLQAVREMTSCTDADAKTIKKRTEKMDQVLTDVQKQINVFNTELEDSRRVAEEWQQALKDIQDKTSFTDADAKTRAKNTEELHQVLGGVQKRMSLFDAELKDARKLTEKMQQDLAEAQSRERSLAQVPPPAKENEAVADLKAVVENLQQEFRGASLRAEVGELQRHMSQLQQAMVEVQERSGQGQDALRGGLDELVQVVEAVRHALCASESEVNELRKASEHCQEVLGATASHGQLEELQKRLVNMEKAMEMNTAKVEEAYQLCMSSGPERRMAPSSQGVEDSERSHAASIDVVAEREALRSSFDESLEEVKAELKLVSFEALSSIEENRCFTAQSCEELHAEVQSLAQRCEEFQAAKEIQGLRGAATESASEALILNFPEASWPPPEAFEETLRSKLKLDPTMQIRLQQRQPGLAAEVQGSSERLQELQRNWASAEMGELSDDLKVCLALRGSSLASETAGARTDALWIDSTLQTFKREVMEDCKECCEEVAEVKAFLLAEQQKQGQQLRELRKSQEGIQESVGAAAKEWCAGLSELRVALTQDMDSSQRQEESLALQRAGVQESLVQLQGTVSLELGEARRHISEFMEEEAARLQAQPFAELLEASKSQAGELDLVRRQLIETVQDRVDLRRQLLDVCRSSQGAQRSHFEQETQTQRAQLQRRP